MATPLEDAVAAMEAMQAAQEAYNAIASEKALRQVRIQELNAMLVDANATLVAAKAAAKIAVKAAFAL
jgi:hypothetical protein